MAVGSEDTLQKQEIGLELQGESVETGVPKASKHQIDSAQRMPIPKGCRDTRKKTLARAVNGQAKQMRLGVGGAQSGVLIVSTEMQLGVRKRVSRAIDRDQGAVQVRPTPARDIFQSADEMLHMRQ